MNINPRTWFAGNKSNAIGSSAIVRASMALGPFQPIIGAFIPRAVNPWFLEGLRESMGILDGAINRLVTMDGILDVEGGNDKLVQLIQRDLIASIPVGDMQAGLQQFYAGQGNEMYEQGFSTGELIFDRRGRELIGLRVADSKGVLFHRNPTSGVMETWYLPPMPNAYGRRDGTDAVETVLRNSPRQLNVQLLQGHGYTQLDPTRLNYVAFNPENDLPYGVSLMRSIEFVSMILLKMHNATGQVWDRFGDPVFHISYKTKNRALKDVALETRRIALANNLSSALNAKRMGNSADFTTAVGADDDISVSIVGANGQVLSIDMPAKQMMEQIMAKTGLPGWMLGIDTGSSAMRTADNQAEMVLQESKTRFEARLPGLDSLVATWLRGRGYTWKPGDWKLVQRLPSLRDELKRAQAGFLNAQTELMQSNSHLPQAVPDNPQSNDSPAAGKAQIVASFKDPVLRAALYKALNAPHQHAKAAASETWAIDDPALPRIQRAATTALLDAWDTLADDTLRVLGLPVTSKAPAVFMFDATSMLQQLLQLQTQFILDQSGADSAMVQQVLNAWIRGIANTAPAGTDAGQADAVIANTRAQRAAALPTELHQVLQKTTVRVYEDDIVKALQDAAYNGINPKQVAAELRKKFADHAYDWERLAGSEISASHAMGQVKALTDMGFTQYDWVLAPEACSICTAIEAAGPYTVGVGPIPVRDSHPGCFCVIAGHADD
ncbi:MAG: hypothetical protein ABIY56_09195 [Dokdonella sp.]